jgi:hypothetical protein
MFVDERRRLENFSPENHLKRDVLRETLLGTAMFRIRAGDAREVSMRNDMTQKSDTKQDRSKYSLPIRPVDREKVIQQVMLDNPTLTKEKALEEIEASGF